VSIPTLRERGEDVLLLAEHFWKSAAPAQRALDLDEAARQALLEYHWPGNVRELRNVVLRAATFSVNGRVSLAQLPPEIVQKVNPGAVSEPSTVDLRAESHGDSRPVGLASAEGTLDEKRAELERAYLLELIESNRGNVTHAARKANMSRQGFHKLLKRHGLSASKYRN
jgi:DNA-binding NtrC family response regulator